MTKQTPLYHKHEQLGAKQIDFAGWMMPIHYGSLIDEHMAVRQRAGIFDVSHMTIIDVKGQAARDFLRYVLANDVDRLPNLGRAQYTCMLNEAGGIIDDLIVYWLAKDHYRLVTNAGTHDKDLAWFKQQAKNFKVDIQENLQLAILALQGPKACGYLKQILPSALAQQISTLKPFTVTRDGDWLLAMTGYTGEVGAELMLPKSEAVSFWQQAIEVGFSPIGLGARDTLRLEAGLNLYGHDMDETTSPFESNLAWTISWHDEARDFIGKSALLQQQQRGIRQELIGLILEAPGVLRAHQPVCQAEVAIGEITSGTYSPYLKKAIAFARIKTLQNYQDLTVIIRNKPLPVRAVKPCFVRAGKIQITPLEPQKQTLA